MVRAGTELTFQTEYIFTVSRSWISGVTSLEVMLAHVVAQFVVMVVQVTFVLVFMLLVFQVSDSGYSMSENFHRSIHYS